MKRHAVRSAVWFVATAAIVYAVLVALAVGVALANGEGLSCRAGECGAVSNWLRDASPVPLIASLALAAVAGVWMARRQARR